jgi:hypothetical protein
MAEWPGRAPWVFSGFFVPLTAPGMPTSAGLLVTGETTPSVVWDMASASGFLFSVAGYNICQGSSDVFLKTLSMFVA